MENSLYDQFNLIEDNHWWFRGRRAILNYFVGKYFRPHTKTPSILDVGCGCGANLSFLSSYGNVSGVDTSEQSLAYCKQKFDYHVEYAHLPDGLDVKFSNLNLITAFDVIEHIEDDMAAIKTLHQRLSVNGMLICTVPAYMWMWSEHDEINHHKRRYTKLELKKKLEAVGFTVRYSSYFNTILFPFAAIPRLLKKILPKKTSPKSDFAIYGETINRILTSVFSSEHKLMNHLSLPFGVSILIVAEKNK